MKVELLIQQAYRFAQRIPAEGDAPDSTLINIGIQLLNLILDEININGRELVLTGTNTTTFVPGEDVITFDNYVDIYEIYYLIGNVRFQVYKRSLNGFFKDALTTGVNALPWMSWANRTETGINLQFYFPPNQNYTVTVIGIKYLNSVSVGSDITGKDSFYIPYLTWRLAQDIRAYNQMAPLPMIDKKVKQISQRFDAIKTFDTSVRNNPLGTDDSSLDIAEVNIMRGWTV